MLTRYSNLELLDLPDCNGLMEDARCKWQSGGLCLGAACSFCSCEDTRGRAYARLRTLPEATQAHISSKYYGGHRPWQEQGKVKKDV